MKRRFNANQVPDFISLEQVSVASPCHADWDAMTGDERSRFCPSCAKYVYNLSAMTQDEAQALLQEKDGRLCIRFYQREDGTMLTQDCPVGAARWKQKSPAFALWAGVASLVAFTGALASPFGGTAQAQPESSLTGAPPPNCVATAGEAVFAPKAAKTPPAPKAVMGKPAVPRPTPAPGTQPKTTRHVLMGRFLPPKPHPAQLNKSKSSKRSGRKNKS